VLTPVKPVPATWFPSPLAGSDVLCLASAGGQQGPILAATGANVTVFDNSPVQLSRDRLVAERDGLPIRTVQGDMADLSVFADDSFDLVFNPVSICFVPDVCVVWREAARVLRKGGALLTGFRQPHLYCLDDELQPGEYRLRFKLPFSDVTDVQPEERERRYGPNSPLEFSHTFSDLIGGQLRAGLRLAGMYEDIQPGEVMNNYMPSYMATRAVKAG
jgi:ubiquinone/menaquinone biosynthesis C-methylase UbiE